MVQFGSTTLPQQPPVNYDGRSLDRQRRMAEMLAQQGGEALPPGQMIGNRFVPTPWSQGLVKALQSVTGAWLEKDAEKKELAKSQKLSEVLTDPSLWRDQMPGGAILGQTNQPAPGDITMPPPQAAPESLASAPQAMPQIGAPVPVGDPAGGAGGITMPEITAPKVEVVGKTAPKMMTTAALIQALAQKHQETGVPMADLMQAFAPRIAQLSAMEKPTVLNQGDQMVNPLTGDVLAQGAPKPDATEKGYSVGGVRYGPDGAPVAGQFTRREGTKEVTYEIRNGAPVKVAEGPAFNPNPLVQIGEKLTTVADANSPTGSVYIKEKDAVGKPAPATSVNKPSDGEQMAKGYHDRMVAAEKLLSGIGDKGYPTELTNSAGSLPFVGDYAKRKASSASQQKYEQAQKDWVRSKLRKESGAVISEQEMKDEVRTYFPQPGDTPEVIAQKSQARQVAIQAMRDAAGPALGKTPTAQPKKDGNLSADEQRELMELRKRFKK